MKIAALFIALLLASCLAGTEQATEKSSQSSEGALARNEAFSKIALYNIYMKRHQHIFKDPKIPKDVKEEIKGWWTLNTFSLMEIQGNDGKSEFAYAANIHTVHIRSETITIGKNKEKVVWNVDHNTDFGLNDKDVEVVRKMREEKMWIGPKEAGMRPVMNFLKDQPLTAVEVEERPGTKHGVRTPHAEMKLKKYYRELRQGKEKNGDEDQVIIGTSKPACAKCHSELNSGGIQNNGQGGLKDPVRWDSPEKIGNLRTASIDDKGRMTFGENEVELCTNQRIKIKQPKKVVQDGEGEVKPVKQKKRKNKKTASRCNTNSGTPRKSLTKKHWKVSRRGRTIRTHSGSSRTFKTLRRGASMRKHR